MLVSTVLRITHHHSCSCVYVFKAQRSHTSFSKKEDKKHSTIMHFHHKISIRNHAVRGNDGFQSRNRIKVQQQHNNMNNTHTLMHTIQSFVQQAINKKIIKKSKVGFPYLMRLLGMFLFSSIAAEILHPSALFLFLSSPLSKTLTFLTYIPLLLQIFSVNIL